MQPADTAAWQQHPHWGNFRRVFQGTSALVEHQLCSNDICYESPKLAENPPFPAVLKKISLQTAKNIPGCRIPHPASHKAWKWCCRFTDISPGPQHHGALVSPARLGQERGCPLLTPKPTSLVMKPWALGVFSDVMRPSLSWQ